VASATVVDVAAVVEVTVVVAAVVASAPTVAASVTSRVRRRASTKLVARLFSLISPLLYLL
jgi:hypothetical protein